MKSLAAFLSRSRETSSADPSRARTRLKTRIWSAVVLAACASFVGVAAMRQDPAAQPPAKTKFSAQAVTEMAQRLSREAHGIKQLDNNSPLRQISYDQYRDIRVDQEHAIWRTDQVPFRIDVLPAGFLFQNPVSISVVEAGLSREITAPPGTFLLGPLVEKQLAKQTIPLSGFRVRSPINTRAIWDEFLVFQGASYFRAVGKGSAYGLSARGLAIRTAAPTGEEFPTFTNFWIERPSANASGLVIHALLQSPSTTGAYKFSVVPGTETVMDVEATLFPRVALDNVGIAPLTSMFLFDESIRTRIDDFRDEVHDSDGLQIMMDSGEQTWRPLSNPTQLQVSSFTSVPPKGFGLVQRSRKFSDYQDLEAQYEKRPSTWIEPRNNWGPGSVQLIEIPTDRETNDNIVAFWRPRDPIPAGKPWTISYRMRWNQIPKLAPELGRAVFTRTGPSWDGKRKLFVIDFEGLGKSTEGLRIDAGTSTGKLTNLVLQPNPRIGALRASFELGPDEANVAELRLRLMRGNEPATETWLYRWTAS
jgi:periplasmic glucans biosynthesis protein